jgi:amidophosphoribosyltransferase
MARDAGANKVYFASASPPVRFPNVYGIDMPTAEELIAYGHSDDEVRQLIGADWLVYQDLDDLIASSAEGSPKIKQFDCAVFDGNYVTGDVSREYLDRIAHARNDQNKSKLEDTGSTIVGLHNTIL